VIAETEPVNCPQIFHKEKALKLIAPPLQPVPLTNIDALLRIYGKDWHAIRDKAVLFCLLDTGAPAAEFLALDIEDVNPFTNPAYSRKVKNGMSRTVSVGKDARRSLRRYLGTHQAGSSGSLRAADGCIIQTYGKFLFDESSKQSMDRIVTTDLQQG